MSSSLSIRTLGSTEILLDRSLVTDFDSRKVTAILIYLGCTGHTCLREVLSMDTLREKTYRHLMLLLAHSGEREAALEQYERCRQLLAYELGTAETTVVYEQIRIVAPIETAEPVAVPPTTAREIDNPCRGLRTSQEADAGDFFGREQLTERLLERIAENGPFSKFLKELPTLWPVSD